MIITEKLLKIQERATEHWRIWSIAYWREQWHYPDVYCFVWPNEVYYDNDWCILHWEQEKNYWMPMNRWRLCYLWLREIYSLREYTAWDKYESMEEVFRQNIEAYQQTVLERSDEIQSAVLEFLSCLPKDEV